MERLQQQKLNQLQEQQDIMSQLQDQQQQINQLQEQQYEMDRLQQQQNENLLLQQQQKLEDELLLQQQENEYLKQQLLLKVKDKVVEFPDNYLLNEIDDQDQIDIQQQQGKMKLVEQDATVPNAIGSGVPTYTSPLGEQVIL